MGQKLIDYMRERGLAGKGQHTKADERYRKRRQG